jgi:hypothetical protein
VSLAIGSRRKDAVVLYATCPAPAGIRYQVAYQKAKLDASIAVSAPRKAQLSSASRATRGRSSSF